MCIRDSVSTGNRRNNSPHVKRAYLLNALVRLSLLAALPSIRINSQCLHLLRANQKRSRSSRDMSRHTKHTNETWFALAPFAWLITYIVYVKDTGDWNGGKKTFQFSFHLDCEVFLRGYRLFKERNCVLNSRVSVFTRFYLFRKHFRSIVALCLHEEVGGKQFSRYTSKVLILGYLLLLCAMHSVVWFLQF